MSTALARPAAAYRRTEVRRIERSDRSSFDGFYERCFDAAYRSVLDPASHERVLAWARSGATDDILYDEHEELEEEVIALGAFAGGRPLGTIVYSDAFTYALVSGLYVDPDFKGAGIGSALMSRVLREILLADVVTLCVMDDSHEAKRFYESIGFTESHSETVKDFDGTVETRSSWMTACVSDCATRLGVLPER